MELLKQLMSDDVGLLSLIVIVVTTVVVCGALVIIYRKVQAAPKGNDPRVPAP